MTRWIDETEDAIESAATAAGWSMVCRSIASTGSRYYEVMREVRGSDQTDQDVEDYGPSDLESFTLRISDHGDAHCSADYSVAERPSGDDTTVAAVIGRLQK